MDRPARAEKIFASPLPGNDAAAVALSRAIETALLNQAPDVEVTTPRAIDTQIETDLLKACQGDGDDSSCVVNFAQSMGVDLVMRPQLAALGATSILTLSLYNAKKAALVAQGQRTATKAEDLLDQVPALVAEVARAGGVRVVERRPRPTPYLAWSAIGAGGLVVATSGIVHAIAFAREGDYQAAKLDRPEARD